PQEEGAFSGGVGVEGGTDLIERGRPCLLNRRTHVSAPEAGHVLEAPDDVIPAHHPEQEQIERQGGGTYITIPENKSAEQAGLGAVAGIVEIAVAVHEEQKHVSVSQVGAVLEAFGSELGV